jgi:23S rRNA (adenine2503-C2)-methyltransferase
LTTLIVDWGEPRYRAAQLWEWLYQHKVGSFDEMHTLPQTLRMQLTANTLLTRLELVGELHSSDGETSKYLFQLPDGQFIETVLMSYDGVRRTACISTQAGCAMGCVFCATGQMGFARHLSHGEIIDQALYVARALQASGERLSNVVLMGMGEPFHNYENSLRSLRMLTDETGLHIGQRHITVSTVGIVPAIRQFAEEGLQVTLAVSLHAATDTERSALLPINHRWPLADLLEAVRVYIARTGRRVTFEWASIAEENDTPEQAHALGNLLAGLNCHLNLIPLNPTSGYGGTSANAHHLNRFVQIVESYGILCTVRVRRGIDINAGCGQLKAAVVSGKAT